MTSKTIYYCIFALLACAGTLACGLFGYYLNNIGKLREVAGYVSILPLIPYIEFLRYYILKEHIKLSALINGNVSPGSVILAMLMIVCYWIGAVFLPTIL